ncbi:dTDP-4-dehydrorhamnose 3,5-epimerase [Candidatus Micrarchaeota archaeon]|nr:dTDP-4-dehydrorhamnose 3,5-epimerase [Candidatus Micrarchaeota archaeon]
MMSHDLLTKKLSLEGATLIRPFSAEDERGVFYKFFTKDILKKIGASNCFSEEFMSISKKGVIRGFHYQKSTASQARLVWCPSGSIFDVIVDLRMHSPTFGKWIGLTLSSEKMEVLYIPHGFAHAFQSLEDNTKMLYKTDAPYSKQDERGIIYNDPVLNIFWPIANPVISQKDLKWPGFKQCEKFNI